MKNWKKLSLQILLCTGGLFVAPVTCNSIFAPAKDDGYDYVVESGSNLRKRVPKGTTATGDTNIGQMSADQFDRSRQQIQTPPPRGN